MQYLLSHPPLLLRRRSTQAQRRKDPVDLEYVKESLTSDGAKTRDYRKYSAIPFFPTLINLRTWKKN